MIIPIWKKIGESTHLLAKKTGEKNKEKATHTGTLDPMAEGIVVVLTGDDRFKKEKFSDWKKTYQFEVLCGIETDSLDLLGLQTNLTKNILSLEEIHKKIIAVLPSFLGKQKQQQPKFSAQRVNGRSGFDLAKQQQAFEIKTNDIEISSIEILKKYSPTLKEVKEIIINKISLVNGDFRQKIILDNWQKTFEELKNLNLKELPIIKIETTVSKRTYIRSIVRDLSKLLKIPMTTFSITRTQEGSLTRSQTQ